MTRRGRTLFRRRSGTVGDEGTHRLDLAKTWHFEINHVLVREILRIGQHVGVIAHALPDDLRFAGKKRLQLSKRF